jgi:hypothetical protein
VTFLFRLKKIKELENADCQSLSDLDLFPQDFIFDGGKYFESRELKIQNFQTPNAVQLNRFQSNQTEHVK